MQYTIKSTSGNPPGANDFGFLVNLGGFSWIKNDHRQEFVWICPIIFPKRFWARNDNWASDWEGDYQKFQ